MGRALAAATISIQLMQQHGDSKACRTVLGCSPSDQQQLSVAALHAPAACCSMLLSLQQCLLQLPP